MGVGGLGWGWFGRLGVDFDLCFSLFIVKTAWSRTRLRIQWEHATRGSHSNDA